MYFSFFRRLLCAPFLLDRRSRLLLLLLWRPRPSGSSEPSVQPVAGGTKSDNNHNYNHFATPCSGAGDAATQLRQLRWSRRRRTHGDQQHDGDQQLHQRHADRLRHRRAAQWYDRVRPGPLRARRHQATAQPGCWLMSTID